MLTSGFIQFGGFKFFVPAEGFSMSTRGEKYNILPTTENPIYDPGYGNLGFSATAYILDGAELSGANTFAMNAIKTGTEIDVTETVSGSGVTWKGFFDVPLIKIGSYGCGILGLPSRVIPEPTTLVFFNSEFVEL